jgi:hypothetical protein
MLGPAAAKRRLNRLQIAPQSTERARWMRDPGALLFRSPDERGRTTGRLPAIRRPRGAARPRQCPVLPVPMEPQPG